MAQDLADRFIADLNFDHYLKVTQQKRKPLVTFSKFDFLQALKPR